MCASHCSGLHITAPVQWSYIDPKGVLGPGEREVVDAACNVDGYKVGPRDLTELCAPKGALVRTYPSRPPQEMGRKSTVFCLGCPLEDKVVLSIAALDQEGAGGKFCGQRNNNIRCVGW